jgi:hypothetical protein
MIISGIVCDGEGECEDEVLALFQQGSEMVQLAGGRYPADELLWLVTTAYNVGQSLNCPLKAQKICKESLSMCRWISEDSTRQEYELIIRGAYGKLLLGSMA